MLPILPIILNRLRGEEGWAGVGRIGMALMVTAPVVKLNIWLALWVLVCSFGGIVVSHRDFFELRRLREWFGMAYTGMLYTAPLSLVLYGYDYNLSAVAFMAAGASKPIAYFVAKKLVGPTKDFIEQAEYIFGGFLGLGLMPAYSVIFGASYVAN